MAIQAIETTSAADQASVVGHADTLLEIRGAVKRFGAITALRSVNLELRRGEVLALLGDNGAGKSTLIRCLSGVFQLDQGEIVLDGEVVRPRNPTDAQSLGISTVYQDLALFDNLSAAGNFFAGHEISWPKWAGPFGILNKRLMNLKARRALEELQVVIKDVRHEVGLMSGGQRQGIAVARGESICEKILILDEPTAALGLRESRNVWQAVKRIQERGISVILISHNLEEVFEIADRAVVLRQGRNVGEAPAEPEHRQKLVSMIIGAE
jgi:D-xylose transport system ATP-binding protein